MIFSNYKKTTGFSIIETLVAIGIVTLGIVGASAASQTSIRAGLEAKDKLIASHLATEGIEYINHLVKSDKLRDGNGDSYINNNCFQSSNSCEVDVFAEGPGDAVKQCGNCTALWFNGTYNYDGEGDLTTFRRSFKAFNIGDADNPKEFRIEMKVTWTTKGENREFSQEANFFRIDQE